MSWSLNQFYMDLAVNIQLDCCHSRKFFSLYRQKQQLLAVQWLQKILCRETPVLNIVVKETSHKNLSQDPTSPC